jgi:hypothetical protein
MTVNISGQVPGEQLNGLIDRQDVLLAERTPDSFLAVVVIERAKRNYDDVKQVTSAVIRFRHIEPVFDEDADEARALLERTYARRTGNESLPITLDGTEEPPEAVEPELDLDTPLEDKEPEEPDPDEPALDDEADEEGN